MPRESLDAPENLPKERRRQVALGYLQEDVAAWVAYAEGARDEATKLMRAAADGEDGSVKHVAMENRLYPMRELLGELLLQIGQPVAALGEFEASLRRPRTAIGASRVPSAPPKPPATDRRPSGTSRSSSPCPARPTRCVRNWHAQRLFSGGVESRHRRALRSRARAGYLASDFPPFRRTKIDQFLENSATWRPGADSPARRAGVIGQLAAVA